MEAVILAGGYGTRLRPLTYTRAKSLLPILNKPMITYLIEKLPSEVDTVILAVNYKKTMIEHYFKSTDLGKTILVNEEPEPLGTGGAVKFAEKHITGPFFVLNSDIICSINLDDMVRFHKKKQAVSTISLWPVEHVSEFGVVDIKKDKNIVRFVEKPPAEEAPSDLINAGAYLLEPQVLDIIKTGHLISMEKEIFPRIIADTGRFFGFEFTGYWIDVGRINSYIEVHKFLMKHNGVDSVEGADCVVNGELRESCIGDHVLIGHDSTVNSSVVFNDVEIGDNVVLDGCVVGEQCTIGTGSTLKNVVIGDNETVSENSVLTDRIVWTQSLPKGYPTKQIGNVLGE
jgi:mannose-1-phosphate guanylyltransferase